MALSLSLLLVAPACGGDSGNDSATDASSTSSPDPSESGSPSESTPTDDETGSTAGGELDRDTLIPAITDAMTKAGSVKIDAMVDVGGQSLRIDGSQRIGKSAQDTALKMSLSGPGLKGQLVLVDSVLYIDLGQPTGGKFVRVDLTKDGPAREQFGGLLKSADTAASVEALQGVLQQVKVVGTEQVDGVQTTHYRLTVDTRAALTEQQLPPEQTQGLPKTLSYDMFVDEDNLLRKMTVELGPASTTFSLSEWGEPVDISTPPKSKISKEDPFSAASESPRVGSSRRRRVAPAPAVDVGSTHTEDRRSSAPRAGAVLRFRPRRATSAGGPSQLHRPCGRAPSLLCRGVRHVQCGRSGPRWTSTAQERGHTEEGAPCRARTRNQLSLS